MIFFVSMNASHLRRKGRCHKILAPVSKITLNIAERFNLASVEALNLHIATVENPPIPAVNLRAFRKNFPINKKAFKRYLNKLQKNPPRGLDKIAEETNQQVWQEINCLSCANCCKKMTPTFTAKDIKRIAGFLKMTPAAFKEKWLFLGKKDKDWVNLKQPCQFLDMQTNKCTIYEVRPADCAGFPHLTKKKMTDYMHVHVQNIEYCPATYRFVEKMMERLPV